MAAEYDLVIRGGTIADGTGGDLLEGDVAIAGGRIAAIGKGLGRGLQEFDAKGKVVTPGFIDVHTHAENEVKGAVGGDD
ncbi:MAG: amidohydrolase family protein, partial [Erythrobacter sp.]